MNKIKTYLMIGMLIAWLNVQANVVADYVFNENLNGSVTGSPEIQYLGPQALFFQANIAGQDVPALAIDERTGLQLEITELKLCDTYSLVMYGMIDFLVGFRKLMDFSELTSDSGLYSNGGEVVYFSGHPEPTPSLVEDEYFQLVWTRQANDDINIFVNGQLRISFNDTVQATNLCAIDSLYFFRDDELTSSEDPSGAVARITVYDHALTPAEVVQLTVLDIIFADDFDAPEQP